MMGLQPEAQMLAGQSQQSAVATLAKGHAGWVRICHWLMAMSVLTLGFSGVVILAAHPRLYWGNAGNDMTKALIELPISPKWNDNGWSPPTQFFVGAHGAVVTRMRTYDPFNDNAWARSLHFLAAWVFVITLSAYAVAGLVTGHLGRDLIPRRAELAPKVVWRDIREHLTLKIHPTSGGPPYGVLQKAAYAGVVVVALPMMVLTGLAMSPAVDAAWHWLPALFGGSQSARTVHFTFLCLLLLFLVIHLLMVVLSGPVRQLRAMTVGRSR